MIRQCDNRDFESIYSIINDAAQRYDGVIPEDRWKESYMTREDLKHEIEDGVVFWGWERNSKLIGVMGTQHVKDVTLIRHAYVRPAAQGQGVGSKLLSFLSKQAKVRLKV